MGVTRKEISLRPTQHGLMFSGILVAMLLGSINYNNNAGFILVFLLGGMASISMVHAYKNLLGLRIKTGLPRSVFSGETAFFPITLEASRGGGQAVIIYFKNGLCCERTSVNRNGSLTLSVPFTTSTRGEYGPSELIVESVFPFGLCRLRVRLPFTRKVTVYPGPEQGPAVATGGGSQGEGEDTGQDSGPDDFQGLVPYVPGSPVGRISWKALSRGRGLFIKNFTAEAGNDQVFDIRTVPGDTLEAKLSRLCGAVLGAEKSGVKYGLRLHDTLIAPAMGNAHMTSCLTALSRYGTQPVSQPETHHGNPEDIGGKNSNDEFLPIITAMIVSMLPHTLTLPPWINMWCILLWGYTLIRLSTGWPMPSKGGRWALTIVSFLGLLLTYRARIGGDAFVGLLALMSAIKPFEMATHRHRMITVLLTYFIIITCLFRSDSLFVLIYMVFSVYITTTALVRINTTGAPLKKSAGLALSILTRAVPMVLILFLLFPRLPGSLVELQDQAAGKTGFSEKLSPGSITRMVRDETPAFRVEFEGRVPPPDKLYWRGIVFSSFDGKSWNPMTNSRFNKYTGNEMTGKAIHYAVLLNPGFGRYLPVLDRPLYGPSWSLLNHEQVLMVRHKISQKTFYRAASLIPDGTRFQPEEREPFIFIPRDDGNTRARELARELADRTPDARAKAKILLDYFKENGFVYTTSPPPVQGPPVDGFLFGTRRGYCEHFASAFAYTMNAMGVPARVVAGYLGGEMNPYGGYLTIRQAYAHAWTEYYDPERGWVRVDPTLVVSPERVNINPDGSAASTNRDPSALSLLTRTKFMLDAINLKWESWFTGYSLAEQQAWLRALGLISPNTRVGRVLLVLTLISLALFAGVVFYSFKKTPSVKDPVAAAYARFLKKLSRIGLEPDSGQGPSDFSRACIVKRPDLAPDIQSIVDLYIDLRYKRQSRIHPDTFRDRIRAFRPGPPLSSEKSSLPGSGKTTS